MKATVWRGKRLVMRELPFPLVRRRPEPWWQPIGETIMAGMALVGWAALIAACVIGSSGCTAVAVDTRTYYAPDPELQRETERALNKLAAATGADFATAEWGVPVRMVESAEIEGACAITAITREGREVVGVEIMVARPTQGSGCFSDPARTIMHEIIHSARRDLDFGAPDMGHTETGVFRGVANDHDNRLDEQSLDALCEGIECVEFVPEVQP